MAEAAPSFPSPEEAVHRINALVAEEAWEELAAHYDLEGSELGIGDVGRWEWFLHGGRPTADPRDRSGPRHPFPAPAGYRGHRVDGAVARVTVVPRPEARAPGTGDDPSGERTFFLIRSGDGWRLLAPDDSRVDR